MRFVVLALAAATAYEAPAARVQTEARLAVSGWRYSKLPPQMHMNLCEADFCVKGSKVSYIFFAPRKDYTLRQFKTERAKVAAMLADRMAGVAYDYDEATETNDGVFQILELRRRETHPNGQKINVISSLVLTEKMSIEVISSSQDARAANDNLTLFKLPLFAIASRKSN